MAKRKWYNLGVASSSVVTGKFYLAAYTPILLLISQEITASHAALGFLFSASLLVSLVGGFLMGPFSDKHRVVPLLSLALIVQAVGTLGTGLATDYNQLLFSRLAVGMYQVIFVAGSKLIADSFPEGRQGFALGIFGSLSVAGSGLAGLIMPPLASYLGWRTSIMVCSLSALPLIFALLRVRDPKPQLLQTGEAAPLVEFLRIGSTWLIFFINWIPFGAELILVAWLPSYLSEELKIPLVLSGNITFLTFIMGVFGRIIGGTLSDRFDKKKLMYLSAFSIALCFLILAIGPNPVRVLGAVLAGWWMGFYSGFFNAFIPTVCRKNVGKGFAIAGSGGLFAAMILTPFFGYLVDITQTYSSSMLIMSLLSLAAFPMIFLLKRPVDK